MRIGRWVGCLTASVLVAAPLAAQRVAAPAAGSSRAVAQRALSALANRNADAFIRDAHPQDLAAWRTRMLPGIKEALGSAQKDQVMAVFAPAKSYSDIEKFPAERLFGMYLQSAMNQVGRANGLQLTNTVLGEVVEGDSLSHVVYRQRVVIGTNPPASNVTLISLRRTPGGWKVLLDAGFMGAPGAAPAPAR